MTKKMERNVAWMALVILLSGGVNLLMGEVHQETQEFTEEFRNGRSFYLETLSGKVDIRGIEGNMVRVKAVKNFEGEKDEAEKAFEDFNVSMKKSRDRIDVVAEFPGEHGFLSHIFGSGFEHQHQWVDFEIILPSHLKVVVDATSADVDIVNVKGDVTLDVTSGNVTGENLSGGVVIDGTSGGVRLKNVGGDVVVDNTSGNADVEICDGSIEIDKTSGEVTLREVGGDVEVDGTSCNVVGEGINGYVSLDLISGDVNLERLSEGISFDNISGDIRVSFKEAPTRESQFSSISGDVTLLIVEEGDLDFDLESVSGDLDIDLEGLNVEELSKSTMKAFTGDRKVKVIVETVSGDVEIQGDDI